MARNPAADSTDMKRKHKGSLSSKKKKSVDDKGEDKVNKNHKDAKNIEEPNARKRPKRAAACSDFKEKSVRLSEKSSCLETKKNRVEEDELVAVELTKLGPEDFPLARKIVDFVLHDADGNPQPFEMSEIDDFFITALIMPMDDSLEKEKERGIRCEGFGRIECWSISGYDEGAPVVWVSTEIAQYECVKPASSYKRFYDRFYEKARICIEIFKKLARSAGGNPSLSLDELIAGVVRSLSGTKSFPDGLSSRDYLISLGDFVYKQLIGLDQTSEQNADKLALLPALVALRDECRSRVGSNFLLGQVSGATLKIEEGHSSDTIEDEDEKLARLLQEEENWKSMKQNSRCSSTSQKNVYIKISETEIANDYPMPSYYKPSVEEMDEFLFFDIEDSTYYPDLPRRVLSNWSLYNSDSRLISLELLPMKPCAEIDVAIFGSGVMKEDDGSGFCVDTDPCQYSSSTSNNMDVDGVPIYLSAIKEWMIEFGSSMIFISIRTDVAWYRLGKPTKQYAPWYEPVLRTARLAVSIITLLKEETRASKLSFTDVVRKVTQFNKDHPAYISSNLALVERYIVVHGQIILQQFAEYPDERIRRCSFVAGLSLKMEQRRHTKLVTKKKVVMQKERNLNPNAAMGPMLSKRKLMRATTTRLINKIWGDYYLNYFPEDFKAENEAEVKDEEVEEEQDENEEEDDESEPKQGNTPAHTSLRCHKTSAVHKEIGWEGDSIGKCESGEPLYRSANIRGQRISVSDAVILETDSTNEVPVMVFVEYMFDNNDGTKMVHGRKLQRGSETILGNAANEREVFLTNECLVFELVEIKELITVDIRLQQWGHENRKECNIAYEADRARAEERKKKGLPLEFYCKSLYWPEKGAFFTLNRESLGQGTGVCKACKERDVEGDILRVNSKDCFVYKSVEYSVHDFVYLRPEFFVDEIEGGTFKAGRNVGLKAYVVGQLVEVDIPLTFKRQNPESTNVKVRRFYRPDDISATKAYSSDIREVYYTDEITKVPIEMLEGKCEVRKKADLPTLDLPIIVDHVFVCEYSYDSATGAIKQLPANVKLMSLTHNASNVGKRKGKEKCEFDQDGPDQSKDPGENRLATLDIFAGCGGLSEGLQKSGVSCTKWAIEYEQPAGEAFSQNHPGAFVFIDNCNVILRAIMNKCGDADDCFSTSEADELVAKLSEEKLSNLPIPGQVDFINGGPPCQGFSGMNRFNQGTWSKVQCEMILAFLSFAEYFRPRFFLLENVRTFVSFNKGQTFRLTLASLLEMGYQVRFGILEAGAYGVSQSRKRAFIWAAAPGEMLPEWPEPMHVFASPELKISLPNNVYYAAVRSTCRGAPFRSITVRDTIGDLPPVENGASKLSINYGNGPVSWFQKQIRGSTSTLSDHISKEMNELNLIRCQRIPKRPGADWRDLPDEKVKLTNGQTVDLIPWCLPNTAKRHNQWKGLFGRLDWEGNFPTSITDPQPMGKVGMCFHPDQDRILTVRECARSQGFRDSYQFCGNIQNKHRQIGNAVPPPLAYALGRKLKEAVDAKKSVN